MLRVFNFYIIIIFLRRTEYLERKTDHSFPKYIVINILIIQVWIVLIWQYMRSTKNIDIYIYNMGNLFDADDKLCNCENDLSPSMGKGLYFPSDEFCISFTHSSINQIECTQSLPQAYHMDTVSI